MHQEASQLLNKSHPKIGTKTMKMTKTKRLFHYLIGHDKTKIETRMKYEKWLHIYMSASH